MNYEQKKEIGTQELVLKDRKKLELTGVKKIESLNSEQFFVSTTLGDILIQGADLEMQHLDVEKGLLWIKGFIYSIEYVEEFKSKKEKNSFLGKLFK